MRQSSAGMLIKGSLVIILVSMIFNFSTIPVGSAAPTTQLQVVAPTSDITVPTQFSIDITVVQVTDLYSWQVQLYYNNAVLRWVNCTLPPDNVFQGKGPAFSEFNGSDAGGVYVLFTAWLQGPIAGFTGSGTLGQIYFEAIVAGTSTLVFSRPYGPNPQDTDTWLQNSNLNPNLSFIDFTPVDGSVNVVGLDTRLPSSISLSIDKSVMIVQESAVISGTINVTVPDTQVIISYFNYSKIGVNIWIELVTVPTTASSYSYTWAPGPEDTGLLGFRAEWAGNSNYKPAVSESKNISVTVSSVWLRVQPTALTVGDHATPLPTSAFTINVTIQDITDLREWKIRLDYNQTILEALQVSLPTYNVFGADYTLPEATFNNTVGFVQVNARSSAASFNGSGVLCQIRFRGIGAPIFLPTYRYGTSNLEFDTGVTFLKDTPGAAMIFNMEQPAGIVRVETATVQPSSITIQIPSQVTIGDNAQITGRINPLGVGKAANVTITIRSDTMTERVLAIVKTDSDSKYSYTWNANATGTFTFKAEWDGEQFYYGSYKETVVTVVEQQTGGGGLDIMTYAIIGGVIAIVVIAVVVLYFVKFRKGSQTPTP